MRLISTFSIAIILLDFGQNRKDSTYFLSCLSAPNGYSKVREQIMLSYWACNFSLKTGSMLSEKVIEDEQKTNNRSLDRHSCNCGYGYFPALGNEFSRSYSPAGI